MSHHPGQEHKERSHCRPLTCQGKLLMVDEQEVIFRRSDQVSKRETKIVSTPCRSLGYDPQTHHVPRVSRSRIFPRVVYRGPILQPGQGHGTLRTRYYLHLSPNACHVNLVMGGPALPVVPCQSRSPCHELGYQNLVATTNRGDRPPQD